MFVVRVFDRHEIWTEYISVQRTRVFGGYGQRTLSLLHNWPDRKTVTFTIEIDIDRTGLWKPSKSFDLPSGSAMTFRFPDPFDPSWFRFTPSDDTNATATLNYN